MALPRPETSKLFARDIAAYSDAELDQYLEAHGRFVAVEDPENLPEDFIQRLRARTGAGDAIQSHPIDLNYVSARLEVGPTNRDISPQRYPSVSYWQLVDNERHELVPAYKDPLPQRYPSVSSTESIDDEEYYREQLERETENYNALINGGGRPSHPISLGYDVANNQEEYREILSFWNPSSSNQYGWMVFGNQLGTWEKFRESQQRMRTDGPLNAGYFFLSRPAEPGRFAGYCRWLNKRLARHGFERPFQLNEDLDRQDQLTTWIEYLGFEYVQYEKHAKIMKRLQQQYDEAWKKLVDSEVLHPFETDESFGYFELLQLKMEKNGAQEAVDSAAAIVQSAEKASLKAQAAGLSGRGLSQIEQKLSVARSKLAEATKLLEQTSRRYELIGHWMSQTKPYRIAKDGAAHQSKLIRWILQQVPLIELELKAAKVTENDSIEGNGRRQRSLKRNRTNDSNEEPVSKRQRQDGENHTLLENKVRISTVQETSLTQPPRQTRSSRTNPITLPSKPCSQRALPVSRPLNKKSDSVKYGVVLDDSARVSKGKRHNKFSLGCTPDSRVLRRSSRPRRPPERFQ